MVTLQMTFSAPNHLKTPVSNIASFFISLDQVKVGSSNLVCRLIVVSISVRMRDYPGIGCVQGHVTYLSFGK